jgi:murein DD-endopeptidase MepM/ murein hydrolase activator NlpD
MIAVFLYLTELENTVLRLSNPIKSFYETIKTEIFPDWNCICRLCAILLQSKDMFRSHPLSFRLCLVVCVCLGLFQSACQPRAAALLTPTATTAPVSLPSPNPLPSATATQPPPAPTSIPIVRLCTPLQGVPLSQMATLVSNPYHPPAPGKDDPHAGVDLAMRMGDTQVALAGHPVQSALTGKVVMTIRDRFPFGNAILIETPLDDFPAEWWSPAEIPAPAPTLAPRSALTCPAAPAPVFPDPNRRSLYVLYAHLQKPATVQPDDEVGCGQVIGAVGATGNALNPHLHFETRVGPSGLQMTSMAHYHASAKPEEMSNYCLWTVSGMFQLIDPMKVLGLKQ